jgi:hypothetical protein
LNEMECSIEILGKNFFLEAPCLLNA